MEDTKLLSAICIFNCIHHVVFYALTAWITKQPRLRFYQVIFFPQLSKTLFFDIAYFSNIIGALHIYNQIYEDKYFQITLSS